MRRHNLLSFILSLSIVSCLPSTPSDDNPFSDDDFVLDSPSPVEGTQTNTGTKPNTNKDSDDKDSPGGNTSDDQSGDNTGDDETSIDPIPLPTDDEQGKQTNELYDYDKINADFLEHNIVARFLAYSDNHVVNNDSDPRTQRMVTMIKQVNAMVKDSSLNDGYNRLDAILDVGDMTGDSGTITKIKNCLNKVKSIYSNNKLSETKLVITNGNHEYDGGGSLSNSDFYSFFNQYPTADVKINGYHFITIDCNGSTTRTNIRTDGWVKGWEYSDATIEQAKQLIQNAYADTGPNKPIFVAMHIGNLNTVIGTDSYVDNSDLTASTKLKDFFSQYSNLVVFSGHSHFNTVDDCAIHQQDFTSLNAGCNAYTMRSYNGYWEYKSDGAPNELKTNRVPMFNYFHDNYNQVPESFGDNTRVTDTSIQSHEDRTYVCGGLIVEVNSANQVRIRSWNGFNKRFARKSWVIDSYDKTKFKYTPDCFSSDDFFFDEGAEIKVDKCINNIVNVKVPKISPNSIDGRVYKIKLLDENNNLLFQRNISTDYYNERFEYPLSFYFKNMVNNKKYTVTAQAFNSLYASNLIDPKTISSNILTKSFTYDNNTSKNTLDPDIVDFDIDVENNKLTRASNNKYGLDPYIIGVPKMYKDTTINKNVIETLGDNSGLACLENYWYLMDKFSSSFTFEAYLKLLSTGSCKLISSQESSNSSYGGFGLEYSGTQLSFAMYNGSSFVRNTLDSSDFSTGSWYHLAFTYDSSTQSLKSYVNGVYKKSVSISNFKQLTAGLSWLNTQMYIGADVTYQNTSRVPMESFSKLALAKFRMYSSPLDASAIQSLYTNLVSNN